MSRNDGRVLTLRPLAVCWVTLERAGIGFMDSADNDITVHCSLGEEDYVAFTAYFYRHTEKGRRVMRKLHGIGIVLFLAFAGFAYGHETYGAARPLYYLYYLAVSALVLGGVYALLLWYIRPTMARMAVRMGPKRAILLSTTFHFSAAGLAVTNEAGKGHMDWASVEGVAQTGDHLFILLGKMNAFIIPKRCFSVDTDAARCYEVAKKYSTAARE